MKTYIVTLPVAGHITFEIEAESKEEAIEAAFQEDVEKGELMWETMTEITRGNVCYFPSPTRPDAQEI